MSRCELPSSPAFASLRTPSHAFASLRQPSPAFYRCHMLRQLPSAFDHPLQPSLACPFLAPTRVFTPCFQLAVLQGERRRSDDIARKSEAIATAALDDKAASSTRADSAEERLREADKGREHAAAERARAEEHLAVALSERKRVEEHSRLLESKLKDELAAVQAHASFAEER